MERTTEPTALTVLSYEYLDEYEHKDYVLWKRLNLVSILAYSLVFVLGTIGNGLVIFITGFRMKKVVNTVWILNLAIADFTFSFFRLFKIVQIGLEFHWPFGYVICKVNYIMVFFNLITSIYLLVVISVDHCIAVWCPVWARNRRTPRLASFVVLCVWILALVLCSPNLYFTDTYYDVETNTTYCFSEYSMMDEGGLRTLCAMVIARFILGFLIPFSVVVVCYGAIVVKLRKVQFSQSSKPFKVITAVIVAFLVCWFPFHVFSFLSVKYEPQIHVVVFIGLRLSYSLAFFKSCLNPLLYFCMGHNFKEKLRLSLLSDLANAFTEESDHSNTKTKAKSATVLKSQNL
ncbi:hypothetical protein lerEdw1_009743 [Lerista edwardsae]|nr:hypothetical protein lerEdw1_009743 [Lerista edwardsae]